MRIVVGTVEISGFVDAFADALTSLGHEVTTPMRFGHRLFPGERYDLDIGEDSAAVDWNEVVRRAINPAIPAPVALEAARTPEERFHWILARHDAFVFLYGSLVPDRACRLARAGIGREYPLLRALGKKIIAVFVGPEIRHHAAYDQQLRHFGSPGLPLGQIVPRWGRDGIAVPLRNLRRAERYAHVILSQPNQSGLALRPYHHIFAPVAIDRLSPEIPGRERPVVVHAPSSGIIKGESQILAALDRLRQEGVAFELRYLRDLPNEELLAELRQADVLIDQLHLPVHGRLGAEAMASGTALVTCDDVAFEPFPTSRPIWPINRFNLVDQLRAVLTDRALRVRLATQGLGYARRWHDQVAIARRACEALEPGQVPFDHIPDFFARHFHLPEGTRIPRSIRRLTSKILDEHPLPEGVSRSDLAARGLL